MPQRHERLRLWAANSRKHARIGVASLTLFAALAALAALSCSSEEKKAGLVVALQTDMSIPKDVDAVELEISVFGKVKYSEKYAVGEDGVHIPATLTLLPPDDKNAPVTIRVISYQKDVPRTLRRVVTTVPSEREALLRMPIEWLCWNQVESGKEGPVSTCEEGSSCLAGSCASDEVDSNGLPAFAATFVFGGASSDAEGTCFDTIPCFARRQAIDESVLDMATCTLETTALGAGGAPMTVDPARLNFGFVPSNGRGICSKDGDCVVPLDHDGGSGWGLDGTTVRFPAGVCAHLEESGDTDALVASTLCDQKSQATPACGKWTGVSGSKITIDLGGLPPEPGTGGSGGTAASGGATGSGGASNTGGTSGSGGATATTNDPNRCARKTLITGSTPYDTAGSLFNRTDYSGSTGACYMQGLEGLEQTFEYVVPPKSGIVADASGASDAVILSLTCEDIGSCFIGHAGTTPVRYFNGSDAPVSVFLTVDSAESGAHSGTLTVGPLNPVCGDGQLTTYDNYFEPCDDGNKLQGDGCSASCFVEPGFACRIPGQLCYLITCGDGLVDSPETCDDDNTIDGDGCDDDCHMTPGFDCYGGEPSQCQAVPPGSIASGAILIEGSLQESMANKNGADGPGSAEGQLAYFYAPMIEGGLKLNILASFSANLFFYQKAACKERSCDDSWLSGVFVIADTPTTVYLALPSYSPEFVIEVSAEAPTTGMISFQAVPACGDGVVDTALFGEGCDDGELVPSDGCSTSCQIDPGWSCTGEPSSCTGL